MRKLYIGDIFIKIMLLGYKIHFFRFIISYLLEKMYSKIGLQDLLRDPFQFREKSTTYTKKMIFLRLSLGKTK